MAQKQVPIDVTSMTAFESGGAASAVAPAAPVRRAVRRDHPPAGRRPGPPDCAESLCDMASAVSPETVVTVPAPASMSLRPRLRASTRSAFRRRCRTKPIVATDKRATGRLRLAYRKFELPRYLVQPPGRVFRPCPAAAGWARLRTLRRHTLRRRDRPPPERPAWQRIERASAWSTTSGTGSATPSGAAGRAATLRRLSYSIPADGHVAASGQRAQAGCRGWQISRPK